MSEERKVAFERIQLPSKGLIYPSDNPLSQGYVDLKYPTASDQDILYNSNLLEKGVMIHQYLKRLIITPDIKYQDMISGDQNALVIASRILSYGPHYQVDMGCEFCNKNTKLDIDLNNLDPYPIHKDIENCGGVNEFAFKLPKSGNEIIFKLLTVKDIDDISNELKKLSKKLKISPEITTKLKYQILKVDGVELKNIELLSFINNIYSSDSLALKNYINQITPDINWELTYNCENCNSENTFRMRVGKSFFWVQQ